MELSQSSVNVITGFLLVLYLLAVLEHGYIRDIRPDKHFARNGN